jgi:DNA-3-methyladenine glycosylase II
LALAAAERALSQKTKRPRARLGAGRSAAAAVKKGALPFRPRAALNHLRKADPVMARVIEEVGAFRLTLQPLKTPFAPLARAIVYQQLSGKAAQTIFGRVQALFPGQAELPPGALLKLPDAPLRQAGLSENKLRALRDLAQKCLDGTVPPLETLEEMSDEQIIERLTVVRGIGQWTAEMFLIFRLGRPDVLPVDDLGIRKGFAKAFRKRAMPTAEALLRAGEKWRPYRTVASWYLWRVLDT